MIYKTGLFGVFVSYSILLGGCESAPVPPSKLAKPAAALMVPPDVLPDIREGDDIGQHTIVVRSMYGKEAGKLRRLQRYVRTVTK